MRLYPFHHTPHGVSYAIVRLSLSLDLLQLGKARQAGLLRANVLALDERQSVVNKCLSNAVAKLKKIKAEA